MNAQRSENKELQSELYATLLEKIVGGELRPGQRLVETDLAQQFHVSRTPVREVLVALAKDGLVERTRNCGARVRAFTPDDVEEIYEIRAALECLAVGKAVRNLPLNALLDIERRLHAVADLNEEDCIREHGRIDIELHRFIISYSGNRRLISELDNIASVINSLRAIGCRSAQHSERARQQHLGIIRALLHRDGEEAKRLMWIHIEASKRNALDAFCARTPGDVGPGLRAVN